LRLIYLYVLNVFELIKHLSKLKIMFSRINQILKNINYVDIIAISTTTGCGVGVIGGVMVK
jgi:hypothetical protein